ncbi:hypothetical protein [Novosphingobium sp.]|uniref:hypothetical protein n=1 Tax=Novosphingobium sp. TaxID=1874826 RepID=UPI00352AFED4
MSFADLTQRIVAIRKLLTEAEAAKALPERRFKAAMSVQQEYYQRSGSDGALKMAFDAIQKRFAEDERRHGEIARDRELKRIATELDRLRADLPELASAARFDLLDTVREFRTC